MERVETLLQKLQQQVKEKLPIDNLLRTVEMLQHELLHLKVPALAQEQKMVAISMPILQQQKPVFKPIAPTAPEPKIIEVLQVDEKEVAAELDEIKRNAATIQTMASHSKPAAMFTDNEEEIPTLIHQQAPVVAAKEINDIAPINKSLNDALKMPAAELSSKLSEAPVKDLKRAIGINDRFLYINQLFRGDEMMYERSIKTINSFTIWPEAEYWIKRELKTKLGWVDSNEIVSQFDQLIKRRFS